MQALESRREKWASWIAIGFGVFASLSLILLSIFDDVRYKIVHWAFTSIWIGCALASAAAQSASIWFLSKQHPSYDILRRSSRAKLLFVATAGALLCAFVALRAVCSEGAVPNRPSCSGVATGAGALEWLLSLGFGGFFATCALDLWPAAESSEKTEFALDQVEKAQTAARLSAIVIAAAVTPTMLVAPDASVPRRSQTLAPDAPLPRRSQHLTTAESQRSHTPQELDATSLVSV